MVKIRIEINHHFINLSQNVKVYIYKQSLEIQSFDRSLALEGSLRAFVTRLTQQPPTKILEILHTHSFQIVIVLPTSLRPTCVSFSYNMCQHPGNKPRLLSCTNYIIIQPNKIIKHRRNQYSTIFRKASLKHKH